MKTNYTKDILKLKLPLIENESSLHKLPMVVSSKILGSGMFGTVFKTEDKNIVFKLTSDQEEINFIKNIIDKPKPEGIVKYYHIFDTGKCNVWGIWRQACVTTGLRTGWNKKEVPLQLLYMGESLGKSITHREATIALHTFKTCAELIFSSKYKNDIASIKRSEVTKSLEDVYVNKSINMLVTVNNNKCVISKVLSFSGKNRITHAMSACLSISKFIEKETIVSDIGEALRFYMKKGFLISDTHGSNMGVVETGEGDTWSIFDPGRVISIPPIY